MLLREERLWRGRLWALALAVLVGGLGCASTAGAVAVRHYEKVSPTEKGQGDIVGDGVTTIASRLGDAVAFNSRTPFGDTVGSGVSGQTQYVARRSEDGTWTPHAVTPMGRPEALQTFFAGTKLQTYSEDLRTAILWAYDLPGVDGDAPARNSIYAEDTATRSLRPITVSQLDPLFFADFLVQRVWGISADAKHVAFVTSTRLLPAAAPGAPNVYQWDDGVLSVAGILPSGSASPSGSTVSPADYRGAMSADGSRLAFSASEGGNPQLYMRIGGSRTVLISQPEHRDPLDNQMDPAGVLLQAMTPDGRNVFFVTDSSLLDDDRNFGPDIYRFTVSADPRNDDGNLTLITHDGDTPSTTIDAAVVGVSDDGERVYYHTITNNVAVWDHGTTSLISEQVVRASGQTSQFSTIAWGPGLGRVTPDGQSLAFVTDSTLGGDLVHGLTGQVTNGYRQMYFWSLRDKRLLCLSCPQTGGGTADATVIAAATSGTVTITNLTARPRFLSDRGQVFFSTAEALVPEDGNGVLDTYEYGSASGTLSLLSTGRGSTPSTFADASASGDDVFIVTRQRWAAADRDNLVDMYDARIGAPLPDPPTTGVSQCDGEGCQPPPSATPTDDVLGSLGVGAGEAMTPSLRAFTVRHRVAVSGASGSVRVRFLAPGKLAWRGRGLRSGSLKRSRAGTYRLHLRLTKHARAQLAKKGSYVTTVRLTFVRSDGTDVTGDTRVTFRAAAKKGR